MARIAINGMGRIGRAALKIILDTEHLELVAVNDLTPAEDIAYLLNRDSVYGRYRHAVMNDTDRLYVDGREIAFLSERDPSKLPWGEMSVDIVLECTGALKRFEDLEGHRRAGAGHVILSTTSKEAIPTIVFGVNLPDPIDRVVSTASCTTNSITPVVEVMGRRIGVLKSIMTTVHAYTSSQSIVDMRHKDRARGRAGAINIVPTSTGAAVATTKVLTQHEGRFDGAALRVPVAVGSVSDITLVTERDTTEDEVNFVFGEESGTERYRGILGVADRDFVSSDIIGDSRAAVVDPGMTRVVDGNLVKVMSWYDNEWGYTSQMVRTAAYLAIHMVPEKTGGRR